jgi:hypothetical protein
MLVAATYHRDASMHPRTGDCYSVETGGSVGFGCMRPVLTLLEPCIDNPAPDNPWGGDFLSAVKRHSRAGPILSASDCAIGRDRVLRGRRSR